MSTRKILVVDSDPRSLRVLEASLKQAGFHIVCASDALDALASVDASPPDLVLADTRLPQIDGFDFVRRLRERQAGRFLPVLFMTAQKAATDRILAITLAPTLDSSEDDEAIARPRTMSIMYP